MGPDTLAPPVRRSASVQRDLGRRKNSVDKLFVLYTVLCAFSLEKAAEQVLQADSAARLVVSLCVGALVVTLVPFYHGALRHVHDTFEEEFAPPTRRVALLVAFSFLFVQAFFFFALASAADSPVATLHLFLGLLAVDIVYGVMAGTRVLKPFQTSLADAAGGFGRFLRAPGGTTHEPELRWVYNNVLFALPLAALWAAGLADGVSETNLAIIVLVVAGLRTAADYWLNWAYYFPLSSWHEEKVDAYCQTTYRVSVDGCDVDIRIGERNGLLDRILKEHGAETWVFVTAFNPLSRLLSAAENRARQEELRGELEARGLTRFDGYGIGDNRRWPPEESYLVLGLSRDEARSLGRRHEQYAVVFGHRHQAAELLFCTA
jgi:hypothetical protein